jgi:hypothetical protein
MLRSAVQASRRTSKQAHRQDVFARRLHGLLKFWRKNTEIDMSSPPAYCVSNETRAKRGEIGAQPLLIKLPAKTAGLCSPDTRRRESHDEYTIHGRRSGPRPRPASNPRVTGRCRKLLGAPGAILTLILTGARTTAFGAGGAAMSPSTDAD